MTGIPEALALKLGHAAAKRAWQWGKGSEARQLIRVLERRFGHEVEGVLVQPDALAELNRFAETGEFRRNELIAAVSPVVGDAAPELADAIAEHIWSVKPVPRLVHFEGQRTRHEMRAQLERVEYSVLEGVREEAKAPSDASAKAGSDMRVFELPFPRNPALTGRAGILNDLHSYFSGDAPADVQAIVGTGGIGKTQVALAYAYVYARRYDVVWWIEADDIATIQAGLLRLADRLELAVQAPDTSSRIAALRQWLSSAGAWLLVFDNVEEPRDLEPLLPSGGGHVIATSRRPDWPAFARITEIGVLDAKDSVSFLLSRTGDRTEAAAETLAAELGHLPLALEQAAAYVVARGIDLADYTGLYKKRSADLWTRGRPSFYDKTVATTWLLSFEDLETHSPAAADLLRACAYLDPVGVPRALFEASSEDALPTLADELARIEALGELLRHSLARSTSDRTGIAIHRLVADQVRERCDSITARRIIKDVATLLDSETRALSRTEPRQRVRVHVRQLQAFAERAAPDAPETVFGTLLAARELPSDRGGRFDSEKESLLRTALVVADQAFGSQACESLPIRRALAALLGTAHGRDTRRAEALAEYRLSLEIAQRCHGNGSLEVAELYLRLAHIYADLREVFMPSLPPPSDLAMAQTHVTAALGALETMPEVDGVAQVRSRAHLTAGHIAAYCGDVNEAKDHYEAVLTAPERGGWWERWEIGSVLMKVGHLACAERYLREASADELTYTKPMRAITLGGLATNSFDRLLQYLEDWESLARVRQRVLERALEDDYPPGVVDAADNLAWVEEQRGNHEKSQQLHEQALAAAEPSLREQLTACTQGNGIADGDEIDLPLSELLKAALAKVQDEPLMIEPLKPFDLRRVAEQLAALGRIDAAVCAQQLCVEYRRLRDSTSRDYWARDLQLLADLLIETNDLDGALESRAAAASLLEEARATRAHVNAEDVARLHAQHASTLLRVGRLGEARHALATAERGFLDAESQRARHGSSADCPTFLLLQELADLSDAADGPAHARRLRVTALELEELAHGEWHPMVAAGCAAIAADDRESQDQDMALGFADRAVQIAERTLGSKSARTRKYRSLRDKVLERRQTS